MVSVKVESIMKKRQSSRVIDLSESLMKWDTNSDVVSNISNLGMSLSRKPNMYSFLPAAC
jgi:hypothetical protein